jgi:hypothetical protein
MDHLREYREVVAIVFAIFATLLAGAFFSDTFYDQMRYMELFVTLGALLFVFGMLVVFAILGFGSFALYMAIFVSIVMMMYGIEGVLLVTSMTYVVWGLIFSIELLLVDNGVESAIDWFRQRYNFESFRVEYYTFYPMLCILYILIELLPNLLHGEKSKRFAPRKILEKMRKVL